MAFAQKDTHHGKTDKESVVTVDYRKCHGILVNDAVDPQQVASYQQVSEAIGTLQSSLTDQINSEILARIAGDQLSKTLLQQAVEGVAKRTVAARYEGSSTPTPADVSGVDTSAPSDNWRSWFLWDKATGSSDTGIYNFTGGVVTRVSTITLEAGLLVFVNSGTFANTQWLMVDDPVGGVADFVPWQMVSDFTANAPLYKAANILRLAIDTQYLALISDPVSGDVQLTILKAFRDRVDALEAGQAFLSSAVATKTDTVAVNTLINNYDRANRIVRTFVLKSSVPEGSIYVHTLECVTGFGTLDFTLSEARYIADSPIRRLDTSPQYIAPDTCRIILEAPDATVPVGAVEGFFERFYG